MNIEQIPDNFKRALSISAHPDDSEFSAGGTLAHLAKTGVKVTLVVCTDGGKGGRDVDNITEVRYQEQEAAAALLGIRKVIRLDYPDGELTASDDFRDRLIEIIRQTTPDVIFGHHPQTFYKRHGRMAYMGHSDHRAAGSAMLDAIYPRAGSPNFSPGRGGDPWSPAEVWLFDCEKPDHLVDVSQGFSEKIAALQAHDSQQGAGGGLAEGARRLGHYLGSDSQPAEPFVRLILRR